MKTPDAPDTRVTAPSRKGKSALVWWVVSGLAVVALGWAVTNEYREYLAREEPTGTPIREPALLRAAREGDLAIVQSLVNDDLDAAVMNSLGETALHSAARAGRIDVATYLISRKADVNARSRNGAAPLHHAAGAGQKAIVELLLANGAEINSVQGAMTPLYLAVMYGHEEVAKLLIDQGANIELGALGGAAQFSRHETARILIERGANVNGLYGAGGGRLPLSLAAQNDDLEMVQLLVQHHADVNGRDALGTPLSVTRSSPVKNYLVAQGAH